MKTLHSFILILLFTIAFASCQKDKEATTTPATITGRWEGSLGSGTSTNGGFFGLVLKSNQQLDRIDSDGDVKATGTWELTGNTFTGTYSYPGDNAPFTLNGTLNNALNKMSGTWQTDDLSGSWILTKNNPIERR